MTAIRCFLALDLNTDTRSKLASAVERVRSVPADVRWVRPESFHVTVKFIGNTDPQTLTEIEQTVRTAVASMTPFSFEVRSIGAFPNLRNPRILWAGIESDSAIAIGTEVAKALAPLGFEPEQRGYHPHVTVGRVRSRRGWRALGEALREIEQSRFGHCKAASIVAYRSDLRRDGAVYTKLWTAEIGVKNGG